MGAIKSGLLVKFLQFKFAELRILQAQKSACYLQYWRRTVNLVLINSETVSFLWLLNIPNEPPVVIGPIESYLPSQWSLLCE